MQYRYIYNTFMNFITMILNFSAIYDRISPVDILLIQF